MAKVNPDDLSLSLVKRASAQRLQKIETEARRRRRKLIKVGVTNSEQFIVKLTKKLVRDLKVGNGIPEIQREAMRRAYKIGIPKSTRGRKPIEGTA